MNEMILLLIFSLVSDILSKLTDVEHTSLLRMKLFPKFKQQSLRGGNVVKHSEKSIVAKPKGIAKQLIGE